MRNDDVRPRSSTTTIFFSNDGLESEECNKLRQSDNAPFHHHFLCGK